ncbi:Transposase [Thalassobacillus cyri]|uniref:Transposase n=1 Tax=Thalassobacillus cyri TaxID=571932 RepID=A0A1H4CRT0_9BACI|nr:IS110 family transposase [Thalassobacillus cyri]SEA63116.1 Transposase [Thalassobacillus cyri]
MDFTQNERLSQISGQTLIVGVDIAKKKHVARAIDDRGIDLAKRLVFNNSLEGFQALYRWAIALAGKTNRSHIMIGTEPTGHYWLNLAYYLKNQGLTPLVVNPMKVKRSKELDDDSPTKNDTKDAKVIAQVIRHGRYHEPTLPEGVYAELREGMKLYDIIQEDLSSIKAQVHNFLDRYFPEFGQVFKDWTKKTAFYFLKQGYLPGDLNQKGEEKLLYELKTNVYKGTPRSKVQAIKEMATSSVGMTTGLSMARQELRYLTDQYERIQECLEELEEKTEELVLQIPGAQLMIAIKGVGPMGVAGFFAEVGNLNNYRDPRQIIKLAGLNLMMNQSGKFKGQTTLTKRGRRRLRAILYNMARPLVQNNSFFQVLYNYLTNRSINPLAGKQAYIAIGRKLIKIFFMMGKRNCPFEGERMLQDIPHFSDRHEAA